MPRVSYGGIGPALLGMGNGYMATTQQNQENADTNAHNKAVIEGLTLQNMERKQQLQSQQALQANLQKLGQFMSGMPASGPDHPGIPMATAGVLNTQAQGVDPNSTELGSAADTSIQTGEKMMKGANFADSIGLFQVASKMREDAKGLLTTGKELAHESFDQTQTETKELDQTLNGIKLGTKDGPAQYAAAMAIINKNPKLAALAAGENLTGDYGKDQQTLAVLQRRWLTQKDALTVDGENKLHAAETAHAYAGAAHENAETKKAGQEGWSDPVKGESGQWYQFNKLTGQTRKADVPSDISTFKKGAGPGGLTPNEALKSFEGAVKPFDTKLAKINDLQATFTPGSKATQENLSMLQDLVKGGRASASINNEFKKVGGLLERVQGALSRGATGEMSDKQIEDIQDYLTIYKEDLLNQRKSKEVFYKSNYGVNTPPAPGFDSTEDYGRSTSAGAAAATVDNAIGG